MKHLPHVTALISKRICTDEPLCAVAVVGSIILTITTLFIPANFDSDVYAYLPSDSNKND
jgi:hypothetical protein